MMEYHFKYCSKCRQKLETEVSKGYGICYYCRNYKKIELKRLLQWNEFYELVRQMPETSRFEIFSKRTAATDLILSKRNFIKTGYMIPPNRKVEQNKIDDVILMIANRDPRIENKIQWIKTNKVGKK